MAGGADTTAGCDVLNNVMITNESPPGDDPARHPTEAQLQAFALDEAHSQTATISEHIAGCLICRVHVGRLKIDNREAAEPSFLVSLSEGSPRISDGVLDLLRAPEVIADGGGIQTGQLWRARDRGSDASGSFAVLVWIRKVFATTAAVLPVFLDTNLADSDALIIPADSTPLNEELVLFSNVDAEIHLSNLVTLIATLDIEADVRTLRMASRNGVDPPAHLNVGLPIVRNDDQRFEFRHIISELLDSLYLEAYTEPDDDLDIHELLSHIRELSFFNTGLRVETLPFDDMLFLDDLRTLHPVAAVHHMSTCVVVTVINGPDAVTHLMSPFIPTACAAMQSRFIEADSVAVCADGPDWPTVLLASVDMDSAIEVPSGAVHTASVYGKPLELSVALLKNFEGASDRWDDASTVRFDNVAGSLRNAHAISASTAVTAVEDIRQTGSRATIAAKKEGYLRLSTDTAQNISGLIRDVLAGGDPTEALDHLLGERP